MIIRDDSPRDREPPARKRPKPVPGEQIRLSVRVLALCGVAFAVLAAISGVTVFNLLADLHARFFDDGPPAENLFERALVGFGGLVAVPVLAFETLRKHFRGRRLVVGADRVQIVEGRGDDAHVLMSLPYANIERMKRVEGGFGLQLNIEVTDPNDPETYFAGTDIEKHFLDHGHHYEIPGHYREPIEDIEALIRQARKRWLKRQGEEEELEEAEEV